MRKKRRMPGPGSPDLAASGGQIALHRVTSQGVRRLADELELRLQRGDAKLGFALRDVLPERIRLIGFDGELSKLHGPIGGHRRASTGRKHARCPTPTAAMELRSHATITLRLPPLFRPGTPVYEQFFNRANPLRRY